ncbi:MAG: SRPBCC family protein [Polyangiaceae bacterium]
MTAFTIDPDIRRARSLPSEAYTSEAWFSRMRDRVFARTWNYVADAGRVASPGRVAPCTLLERCLDEPVVLTRDAGGALHALSNVCTHRGNLVVADDGDAEGLRCRYHGRRFGLDGRFVSMPEFDGVEGFPSASDDLARVPLGRLEPLLFASVEPAMPFDDLVAPLRAALPAGALDGLTFAPERSRDYPIAANWALYCDNYLEGFHIPFVHPGLAAAVEYASYRTDLARWGTVQVARAKPGEDAFPGGVAAYYAFLFPATMLNVYPWGLSVNVVRPQAVDRTVVSFRTYVRDPSRLDRGAGADLHAVEMEDEAVVQSVQRGVRSRLYRAGRYSPTRETGVHHFHRLLAELMTAADPSAGG